MKVRSANVAASVRQRLHNVATERNEDFEQLLVRYALERLLYRLSISAHADRFVLKGALLFRLWFELEQRPTRDADFLGYGPAEPDGLASIFRELAIMKVQPEDGVVFNADSVVAEDIRKIAGYPGVRVSLKAELAKARIPVQCDIGFGDVVTPDPSYAHYPTLLDLPAPKLLVYPLETVIAEKLEAVVKFGAFNSRLKDYFDLWVLMRYERIDVRVVVQAVRATFARRGTPLPAETPAGLAEEFARNRRDAWEAFVRQVDQRCPIHEELAGIFRKTAGLADVLREALAPLAAKIRVALVFGSVAQGKERATSDIDVLVVGSASFAAVVEALRTAAEQLRRDINPVVMTRAQLRAKFAARDRFVSRIDSEPKLFLLGDAGEFRKLAEDRAA